MPLAHRIYWELLLYDEYSNSEELLTDLYLNKKMAIVDIGEILGVDKAVVKKELDRLNIPTRRKGRPKFPKNMVEFATVICSSSTTFATMTITRRAIRRL
jgi:hypothetical protein